MAQYGRGGNCKCALKPENLLSHIVIFNWTCMGKLQQRYPPRSAHLGVEWLVVQPNAQDVGSELCLRLQETPKHRWHIAAPLEAYRDRATEVIAVGAVLSWCGVGEDGSPVRVELICSTGWRLRG